MLLLASGALPAVAHASTIISSNEGMTLGAGQLSVGSVVTGTLSGVINSSIQGTYPQATWSDTTGSGAGWQGSLATSSAVYTGAWVPQGSAAALGSSSAGGYTGTTDGLLVSVSVGSGATGTSTPFTWSDNQGNSGSGTATNGVAATVEQGLVIDFASGTTYSSGATYVMQAGTQSASALELLSSSGLVSKSSGTVSPSPTLVNNQASVVSGGIGVYGTSVPFMSAAINNGMGSYLVSPGVDVVVDASSWAATYTSQVQYTIASGPGSAPAQDPQVLSSSPAPPATDSYTGNAQTYTVPSGVQLLSITGSGAQGAGGGGYGGSVTETMAVSAGQQFTAYVGQQPSSSAGGGVSGAPNNFGVGGAGAGGDGGGGGATSVYTNGTSPSDLVLVAGAGGGGGGGGGGGNPGIASATFAVAGGGTQTGGGYGASLDGSLAQSGGFGYGGAAISTAPGGPAGGGGGGYYGGGGGAGNSNVSGAGGGGASWAVSSAELVSYTTGNNSGNGQVMFQPEGALPPSNVVATYSASTGAVTVTWTDSTSSNVEGYAVLRSGSQIAALASTATSYTDTSAPQSTTVTYGVEALTSGLPSTATDSTITTGSDVPSAPATVSVVPGATTASVTWSTTTAANSYNVYRDGTLVDTTSSTSFADSTLTAGSTYKYTVEGVGAGGPGPASTTYYATPSPYAQLVVNDGASLFWQMNEASGTTAQDQSGHNTPGTYGGGPTLDQAPPNSTIGGASIYMPSPSMEAYSQPIAFPAQFSMQVWFKTSTTNGGYLVGWLNSAETAWDPVSYMTTGGTICFEAYDGGQQYTCTAGAYNNNQWHDLVVSATASGMQIWIDGTEVASNSVVNTEAYTGMFRVGGGKLQSLSGSDYWNLVGSVADAALYPTPLTSVQVQALQAAA